MVSTMKANIDELGRRFADHEKRVDARFESSKERIEQTEKRIHDALSAATHGSVRQRRWLG